MFSLQLPHSLCSAYNYPIYGTQWHPEKNAFFWNPRFVINHSKRAVKAAEYFARFFVNEGEFCFHRERGGGGGESCVCACVRACVNACVCAALCKLVSVAMCEKMCLSGGRLHVGIILSIIMCSQSPVSCFVIYELVNGWVHGWMSWWVGGLMGGWVDGWVSWWLGEGVNG